MAFKKRYILAEEAEERIVSLFRKERNDAADIFNTAIDACQSIILDMYDNAPDVVEVVRCKECWKRNDEDFCPLVSDNCYPPTLPDDWFCKDGERRDDAEVQRCGCVTKSNVS